MANEISYPKLSVTNWWALRKKFQGNSNIKITPGFLAMHFEMGEDSARTNVIPPLRAIGFIDDDGKPTDLAYDWRDDAGYAAVCENIRRSVYPQELNDAVIDPADRTKVESWFKNKARVGEASARKMAAFYLMLCEASIPGEQRNGKMTANDRSKTKEIAKTSVNQPLQPSLFVQEVVQESPAGKDIAFEMPFNVEKAPGQPQEIRVSPAPNTQLPVQISIQIHISPDHTPEQVDQIFASLVKNLKNWNQ
jgi:Family of unknown function (DUF5343)